MSGSGQRHMVINTRTNPDGSMVVTINDVVRGTAWDLTGPGTYNFVYQNHSVERIPAGAGAHQVSMEDNFVMNGDGTVGHRRSALIGAGPIHPRHLCGLRWTTGNRSTRGAHLFTCDPIENNCLCPPPLVCL